MNRRDPAKHTLLAFGWRRCPWLQGDALGEHCSFSAGKMASVLIAGARGAALRVRRLHSAVAGRRLRSFQPPGAPSVFGPTCVNSCHAELFEKLVGEAGANVPCQSVRQGGLNPLSTSPRAHLSRDSSRASSRATSPRGLHPNVSPLSTSPRAGIMSTSPRAGIMSTSPRAGITTSRESRHRSMDRGSPNSASPQRRSLDNGQRRSLDNGRLSPIAAVSSAAEWAEQPEPDPEHVTDLSGPGGSRRSCSFSGSEAARQVLHSSGGSTDGRGASPFMHMMQGGVVASPFGAPPPSEVVAAAGPPSPRGTSNQPLVSLGP